MLSPKQAFFIEHWRSTYGRALDELMPVQGGFAHPPSRVLILLGSSDLEVQASDYGWLVAPVEPAEVAERGLEVVSRRIADIILARAARARLA